MPPYQIQVPTPANNGGILLVELDAVLRLQTTPVAGNGVAFQITDPRGIVRRAPNALGTFYPTTALGGAAFFDPAPSDATPGPFVPGIDVVTPEAPPAVLPSDPNAHRFRLHFELLSDYDITDPALDPQIVANETWNLEVILQNPGANAVESLCVTSFRYGGGLGDIDPVLLPASGADVLNSDQPNESACGEARPGIDVILVLDKSGSMNSSTLGGAPRPKIEALRDAVLDFMEAWADIRASEGADAPSDQVGVVLFDSTANWWGTVGVGLQPFATAQAAITLANLNTIVPGGNTSIGAGLLLAANTLAGADPTRRRAILLMSNGKQNTNPHVGVEPPPPAAPTTVFTYDKPAVDGPDLPNQANYQIYTVTVGTGTAVSAQINEDIAAATDGFYIGSEVSAEVLRAFFLELLQNFVRFNTWETARLVNGQATRTQPMRSEFYVSTTTTQVQIQALWPQEMGHLRMTVLPPGWRRPIIAGGSGSVRISLPIPPVRPESEAPDEEYDYLGAWRVAVSYGDVGEIAAIPIDIVVLVDDKAVNADLRVAPATYAPGDNIRLEATLTELGRPIADIGTRPGELMLAQVIKPGQSIGDLLATAQPDTSVPLHEPMSPADTKLFRLLQSNPDAFKLTTDTIVLRDDGSGGDLRAGDGIYSGLYQAREPGIYTFLFGAQGRTRRAGIFSRQQVRSVYVRAIPDPEATTVSTSTRGNVLAISFQPRTRFGNLLGPGFANYFWFTAPGITPFRPQDNLSGGYTAQMRFDGDSPPAVSLHFLNVSIDIGEETGPNQLPVKLGRDTTLIGRLPNTGGGGTPGDDTLRGCLIQFIRLLMTIARLSLRVLERLLKGLGG